MPIIQKIRNMSYIGVGAMCLLILFAASTRPFAAVGNKNQTEERFCEVKGVIGSVKVRYGPSYKKVRREIYIASSGGSIAKASSNITFEWTDLRLGMVVGEHCEIMTAAESEVRLETAEGSIIRIGESTLIEVAVMRAEKMKMRTGGKTETVNKVNTKFKVNYGDVVANIKKLLNDKTDVRFETPTSTAAIRGTVIEIEAVKDGSTVIRAFDGTIHIAPAGSKHFVEVNDGNMVDIAPKQRALFVKPVPKEYKRKDVYLKNEKNAKDSSKSKGKKSDDVAVSQADSASVKLTLDIGDMKDTIKCYINDTIIIVGTVNPVGAKVTVNGLEAVHDNSGVFKLSFQAPTDSGAFVLNITAANEKVSETVVKTVNVAYAHTEAKLITPAEGLVVNKPSIFVSGTAEPGSKINVLGVTLNSRRDGTFGGEIGLPPKEGNVKIKVEIINKNSDAIWFERNIKYKK